MEDFAQEFQDSSALTELSEEESRQLDEAWDDPEGESEAGYVAETDDLEEDHPGAAEPEQPGGRTAGGNPEPEGSGKQTGGAQEPDAFTLKHLDEVRTVGRDEVVKLAQQGMDYERVRSERDQLRKLRDETGPALELIRAAAVRNGMTSEQYVEFCRRQQPGGRNIDARVSAERRAAGDEAGVRRREGMRRFLDKFPSVRPEEIPGEVWNEVAKGESLIFAYTLNKNTRLEAELAAERQNRENAKKTTGSLAGGLAGIRQDEFDRWWNDED